MTGNVGQSTLSLRVKVVSVDCSCISIRLARRRPTQLAYPKIRCFRFEINRRLNRPAYAKWTKNSQDVFRRSTGALNICCPGSNDDWNCPHDEVVVREQLPDNRYDRHTLQDVIDRTETLTGCAIERAYVDKGHRGHDVQDPPRVFISGQKRGVFGVIKRELRRRSAIEPIIGHLKADGHLGRCYLKGSAGDGINVILSAVGHNFRTSAAS